MKSNFKDWGRLTYRDYLNDCSTWTGSLFWSRTNVTDGRRPTVAAPSKEAEIPNVCIDIITWCSLSPLIESPSPKFNHSLHISYESIPLYMFRRLIVQASIDILPVNNQVISFIVFFKRSMTLHKIDSNFHCFAVLNTQFRSLNTKGANQT